MYSIETIIDSCMNTILRIYVPREELDENALQVMTEKSPSFLLPFRYEVTDSQVEFRYRVDNKSKLIHLSAQRSPEEYIRLWTNLLQPLIDCERWSLNLYSFVLDFEHVYCSKAPDLEIFYLYVPSIKNCSDHLQFKEMVTEIVQRNHVKDIAMENDVMRTLRNFNPREFLEVLDSYRAQRAESEADFSAGIGTIPMAQEAEEIKEDRKGFFGFIKGMTGKKKEEISKDIVSGAAKESTWASISYREFEQHSEDTSDMNYEVTALDVEESDVPKLRYVGYGSHPRVILVEISSNLVFTIGRFDVSVGHQQSDFEFDKKTKAVSRKHAAIELRSDGYYIVDLDSAAGTYVNGRKLTANMSEKLTEGCRVSFGHAGADYIWEA